jgi:tripartite-type tricarboxylate transporter receptor subunit TctC
MNFSVTARTTRRKSMLGLAAAFTAFVSVSVLPGVSLAQDNYPNRPVRIILPFGTGGVSDIAARLLAEQLSETMGQRFLVENVPGAGGAAATQLAFQGDQEGYTLLNMGNSATIRRTLMPNIKPDQIDDFQPVAPVAEFGLVIVTAPSSEIKTVQDLVAKAKAAPGAVNIGSVAVGSTQHLTALLFETVAGIDVTVVPYQNSPELMGAVARGEVDAGFEISAGAVNSIKNKQVDLIATTRSKRSAVFPDVPTVEESGVAPFDVASWNSYVTTKGVPEPVVKKLNTEIQRILTLPEVREKMLSYGIEPFEGGPEAVTARIETDVAKWRDVIEKAGVPVQQ